MHVWVQTRSGRSDSGCWQRIAIQRGGLALSGAGAVQGSDRCAPSGENAVLAPFSERGVSRIALVRGSRGGVFLNGHRPLPVVVLRDRDEINIGPETFVFAEAEEARVEVFEPLEASTHCQLCSVELLAGDEIVRCPVCAAPHHEGLLAKKGPDGERVEQRCWTLGPVCGGCQGHRESMVWVPDQVLG